MKNYLLRNYPPQPPEEYHPAAGALCLGGFFLHILFSDPLLNALGLHYSLEGGNFLEKIHPGSYLILFSFFILLWSRGNPINQAFLIYRRERAGAALLICTLVIFFYTLFRGGADGLAFLIDTHMTVPICAIVLCHASPSQCQKAARWFLLLAALNSVIGIAEAAGQFRIFNFRPAWGVLLEDHFRASALLGHPLDNAMFTSVALFMAAASHNKRFAKLLLMGIMAVSLVAFGGRAGLAVSLLGLILLGIAAVKNMFTSGRVTLFRVFLLIAAILVIPPLAGAVIYALISSRIGERIASHMLWDDSAASRVAAWDVFNYLSVEEIIFGIGSERILDVAYQMGEGSRMADLENPWLLMLLQLGVAAFLFWLAATIIFALRLLRKQPLGVVLAVLGYFVIASTSNSFGRKDPSYLIMTGAVICVSRALSERKSSPGQNNAG